MKKNKGKKLMWGLSACIVVGVASFGAADWPQLQRDAQRTGRTMDSVQPPIRLRWMWQGAAGTIRNRLSNPSWVGPTIQPKEAITSKTTVPTSVPFTLARLVQPIVVSSIVYIGDQDGKIYAIRTDDGSTLWTAENPGGTMASGAYGNGVVVFGSLAGTIRGYNAMTGTQVWEAKTDGAITAAPAVDGSMVCVGSCDGCVYYLDIATGNIIWKSASFGRPIAGGLAMDTDSVYVGVENMMVYALRRTDGGVRHSAKVSGQSFYGQWPVVYSSFVFIEAAGIPQIGSEHIPDNVFDDTSDYASEENNIRRFLQGDTNNGRWPLASPDWKHLTVLRTQDLTEPYTVAIMPFEGCGSPPEPPVVDNQGRVLTYFQTKFPTFIKRNGGVFGIKYSLDIAGIDLANGARVRINNGRFAEDSDWFTWESDNLYGMCVGGDYLYLHQDYRGTVCINLKTSNATRLFNQSQEPSWINCNILYTTGYDDLPPNPPPVYPSTTQSVIAGRTAPVVVGDKIFFRTAWALFCGEHHQ